MNASQLLHDHFDRISDVPDAIPRLRRFILDLAVRGTLVGQDPSDEPASKLLRDRELVPNPEDEPWPLPPGWAWSSYGLIGETLGGGTPSKGNADYWNGSIPWVSPKDMKVDFVQDAQDHISQSAVENSAARLIPPGSLLMVVRGMILAHSFPTAIAVVSVTINQDMKAVVPFRADLSPGLLLISKGMKPEVMRLVTHSTHGTCKLLTGVLFSMPLPVPPLAEQRRIVAKVDELMALCDRLEAAQAERERRRDRLTAASLQRLSVPDDTSARREHADFHLHHLSRMTTRPDQISAMREAIRTLAVRSRLVRQDPSDEPASELMHRIQNEKKRLLMGGAAKRLDPQASIDTSDVSAQLPESWIWARTESVCEVVVDCPHSTPVFVPSGIVCIDTNCFKAGALIPHKIRYVSETTYLERVRRLVPRTGDIIFAREGSVGASVIVPEGLKCCLGQRVMLFRLMPHVLPAYFSLALSEDSSLTRLLALHKGIGAKHVNVQDMREALIPLPPIAEQHRIVEKVDELMAVCDRLEAQLTATQTESRRLLEAVLHQALAPSV